MATEWQRLRALSCQPKAQQSACLTCRSEGIQLTYGQKKPHVDIVTCRKPTAQVAEERALIHGWRWVDRTLRQALPSLEPHP
jgi:hypothetical protein